ncbi:MAG: lipocalin family protein [Bacteroidia bacterium]
MNIFKNIAIAALVSITFLSACKPKNAPTEEITGRWSFVTVHDEAGNEVRSVAPGDYMHVRKDNTFTYELANENIASSGNWRIDEQGDLIYIYDGNGNNGERTERKYHIEEVTDSTLIFTEEGVSYEFARDNEEE